MQRCGSNDIKSPSRLAERNDHVHSSLLGLLLVASNAYNYCLEAASSSRNYTNQLLKYPNYATTLSCAAVQQHRASLHA
jgi:hypothetical protein